jgi:hypothetical protein
MLHSTGCAVSVNGDGLAAQPLHEAALGGSHAPMNRRYGKRGFSCDLLDAPAFAAAQPQAATLFFGQTFEQSEQESDVDLKVWQRFERRQDIRVITSGQERPLEADSPRVVNRRTPNYYLQPADESRRIS